LKVLLNQSYKNEKDIFSNSYRNAVRVAHAQIESTGRVTEAFKAKYLTQKCGMERQVNGFQVSYEMNGVQYQSKFQQQR